MRAEREKYVDSGEVVAFRQRIAFGGPVLS